MMIAEAFLPAFGALGIGGVIAFVLGGLFLTDTGIPGLDLSVPFLIGCAVVSVVLIMAIGALAARAHRRAVVSGQEEMPGLQGVVTSVDNGTAYASVRGEGWRVHCNEKIGRAPV